MHEHDTHAAGLAGAVPQDGGRGRPEGAPEPPEGALESGRSAARAQRGRRAAHLSLLAAAALAICALLYALPGTDAFRSVGGFQRMTPLGASGGHYSSPYSFTYEQAFSAGFPFAPPQMILGGGLADPWAFYSAPLVPRASCTPQRHARTRARLDRPSAAPPAPAPRSPPLATRNKGGEDVGLAMRVNAQVGEVRRGGCYEDLRVEDESYDEPEKLIPDVEACIQRGACTMRDGQVELDGAVYACAPSGDQRLHAKVSLEQCALWYRVS